MTGARPDGVTFVETCALALWLGASVFFAAIVAPAAFAVLPSPALAGALVGRLLPALFVAGIVVALIILTLEVRSPRPGGRLRSAGAVVMLVACAGAQFVIGRQIDRVRVGAGAPIDALSRDDPRRAAFGRLHALSVASLGAAMIAAAIATAGARSSRAPRS